MSDKQLFLAWGGGWATALAGSQEPWQASSWWSSGEGDNSSLNSLIKQHKHSATTSTTQFGPSDTTSISHNFLCNQYSYFDVYVPTVNYYFRCDLCGYVKTKQEQIWTQSKYKYCLNSYINKTVAKPFFTLNQSENIYYLFFTIRWQLLMMWYCHFQFLILFILRF